VRHQSLIKAKERKVLYPIPKGERISFRKKIFFVKTKR